MDRHRHPGDAPPIKEETPTRTVEAPKSHNRNDIYSIPDTVPMSYPRQEIFRSRGGGWDLVRWDGYGTTLRAWRPCRGALLDLLDRCGGRLTQAAADVVMRGRG